MKTTVCIASGPSLNEDHLKLIPKKTDVICVNDNYRIYKDCTHVFAADTKWWKYYHNDVLNTVNRDCRLHTTYKKTPRFHRVEGWRTHHSASTIGRQELYHGGSSGLMAIELARVLGATKIILIGYDGQVGDKMHWFGDHPEGFSNASAVRRWPNEFAKIDKAYKRLGINLVNCSISTALTIRRSTLEEELQ